MPVFIQRPGGRVPVESLRPYLREPLSFNCVMDEMEMLPADRENCLWKHFGIGKGVSSPSLDVSVFGIPAEYSSGLHGVLIQGFPRVDSAALCYEPHHNLGFADFARWVYFSDPDSELGFLGVDFSIAERPTAGVCHTVLRVGQVAECCARHGIPAECELVLLNSRMCEEPYMTQLRREWNLTSVADWATKSRDLFGDKGAHCPRCGLAPRSGIYCSRCGCKPQLILQ